MREFFEPPPPRPEEPEAEHRQPPWFGPPHGTLPGVVALELVLAKTDKVAVYVSRLLGYPTGFGFDLMTASAPGQHELDLDPMLFGRHRRRTRRGEQELDPDLLRIGVQFSDGAKATNIGGSGYDQDPPPGPVMHSGGGGGGGGGGSDWHQTNWVWPLPPPGPLSFVCQWPAAEIALTRAQIDAELILDAAGRAQDLFPDHGSGAGGSWTSYAPLTPTIKPTPQPSE